MMGFLDKYRTSIATRFMLQALAVCTLMLIIIDASARYVLRTEIQIEVNKRADVIMRSLQGVLDLGVENSMLVRAVHSLGGEKDVRSIIVMNGDTRTILAATEKTWTGKLLAQTATDDIRMDLNNTIRTWSPVPPHFHKDQRYETTLPVYIRNPDKQQMHRGAIHLIINTAALQKNLHEKAYVLMGIFFAAMILLVMLFHFMLHRCIFGPLNNIRRAMELRRQGKKNAYAVICHRDEIGRMTETFNDMLDKVAEGETRLAAVLNTVVDGIITIDEHGTIQEFNPGAERMFGYKKKEVTGQNVKMLMDEPHRSLHDGYLRHYGETGEAGIIGIGREVPARRKDGSIFPMDLAVNTTVIDGKKMFVGSTRDITERKLAAEKLSQYAAAMEIKSLELDNARLDAENARLRAEETSKLKSEFLANMSHEIRTPMNGVIGMTNLLMDCDLGETERRYARTIFNSAEALLQIINDILDFSKIEAGKIDLESIPFDLRLLFEETCEAMAPRANEKGVEMLLDYPPDATRYVTGDPGRIRQILFNLLSNAVKFTKDGHILLSLRGAARQDGGIKFNVEVEDTGIGIPADKTDFIFNKFTQVDQSTARKFGGTGLGLAICKDLSRMMGGDIGVRSAPGAGSTFWFSLVLKEDAAEGQPIVVPEAALLKGIRLLVVDDNAVARTIVREQMKPYAVTVIEAGSAKEALEITARGETFDIAILDFMMPEMDGAELARRLRQTPATEALPLVMITSAPSRGDKLRMEEIGFAGYLSKPFTHWQLRDILSMIIKLRKMGKKSPIMTHHSIREASENRTRAANKNLRFSNAHILVAEDNPTNQQVITAMLEKYGCRALTANDGNEAVKLIKQRRFDLVLMDCQMPGLDGYEATGIVRKLEKQQNRPSTPIVACTAHALKGDDEKCFAAGMNGYISKPVRQTDLERILIRWLPADKRVDDAQPPSAQETAERGEKNAIDAQTSDALAALMGDRLPVLLRRYIETSADYIGNIFKGLETGDPKTVTMAAHTLKSSSMQIGAVRVSGLSEQIERLSSAETPDISSLKKMAEDLRAASHEVQQEILSRLSA